jgi:DNA-binding transcriptional ArsR family regulator
MNEASIYSCLADPTRLAILHALGEEGEATVGDLVEAVEGEQSNVSHHLRQLRDCGLVTRRADGRTRPHRIAHPRLEEILDLGAELADHIQERSPACCPPEGCR